MLAVSPARCSDAEDCTGGGREGAAGVEDVEFDFTVDDIDFADFFVRLEDGDALPDLEVDPAEIFTDFQAVAGAGDEVRDQEVPNYVELSAVPEVDVGAAEGCDDESKLFVEAREEGCDCSGAELAERKGDAGVGDEAAVADVNSGESSSSQEAESRQKPSSKSSQGKKKAKVDWTPELHRRFVQAVEQLGIDKAVPSRILEIMGIDSLTRHNIASHLQKYRSHRKHMLARETEAANWTQRRQMYATGGGGIKRDANPWTMPTIGFPPPLPPPPPPVQHFRPWHVWGHPTMDSPHVPVWPRHLIPRALAPPWASPPSDPSFWHHHYMRGPAHMPTQGTPCMAIPVPATRFHAPPVPGIVPCSMYRPLTPPAMAQKHQETQLQVNSQPSNESIDAAIGDVLTKPWLPLPLGLKPPSVDSVMGELQRQGVPSVPPACG